MFEQMFQMSCQRDRFILPARQTNQRADAKPAKTGCVTALNAIEPKIEIAFRSGGVHLRINAAIVGLLINDKTFRASLDNRHVIFRLHRAYLNGNGRKIGNESAHAFIKITAAYKFRMLASDKQNLPKSLAAEMLRFSNHFIYIECDAKDRIVA